MTKNTTAGLGIFAKYLTLWVIICMIAGVLIGRFVPFVPEFLGTFEYANVSIPIAILIWVMIYPMMLKVDFKSVKYVGKNPKGLVLTWVVNWLIKPFTMFAIAAFFFYIVFSALIPPELARDYLIGAVLLGAAPCTAMVFVWSHLTKGNAAYTVVQVATNDLIILVAFVPIVGFLLGIGGISIPWVTLFLSVVLFVVIPLLCGVITRMYLIRKKRRGVFYQNVPPEVRQHHHRRAAAYPRDHLLVSGNRYYGKSTAYSSDRRTADHPDDPDLLYRIRRGMVPESPSQYCSPGRYDRRFELLRISRRRFDSVVRNEQSGRSRDDRRGARRSAGDAHAC